MDSLTKEETMTPFERFTMRDQRMEVRMVGGYPAATTISA